MITVAAVEMKGFDQEGRMKVLASLAILENIFNQEKFRQLILDYSHPGNKGFYFRKNMWGKYIDTPYSNQQVLSMITNAVELSGNVQHGQVDLYLNLDPRKGGGTVGYGYPSQKDIYTYSDWFTSFNSLGYASHIAHEWCHKLGFTHSHKKSEKRKYSVPYAIGYMVGDLYTGSL